MVNCTLVGPLNYQSQKCQSLFRNSLNCRFRLGKVLMGDYKNIRKQDS